jgi:triacylglycerol lipase
MKRAIWLLGTAALVGCNGPVMPEPGSPTGGDKPGAPTTPFPTGGEDPGPRTAYPLILAHGLDGFENIGPINYFYGVADALRKDGHQVFTPQVDAYNSSEVRGEQLLTAVQNALAQTGAAKVKMVCHSQGGLDCRYVASKIPDKVAAIVTISTPHRGTPVSDIALGLVKGPARDAMAAMLNMLGAIISGHPDMNAEAALEVLTSDGAAAFTERHPDSPMVDYYSIAGRSNMVQGDVECATPNLAPFVGRWAQYLDPADPLLAATGSILNRALSPVPANDGLVPVASARWGTFLGCIPADHLDEMCQLIDDPPGQGNAFDCHLFYQQLAQWMVARGY